MKRLGAIAAVACALVIAMPGTALAQYTSPPDPYSNWHFNSTFTSRAACTSFGNYMFNNGHVANDACVDHPSGPGSDLWIIPHANTEV